MNQHSPSSASTCSVTSPADLAYRCEVFGAHDVLYPPEIVVFSIDKGLAETIVALAALVQEHGLVSVSKESRRARFLKHDPDAEPEAAAAAGDENELQTEGDVLVVTEDQFYFSADVEHADSTVQSAQQSIDELREHFSLN